MALPELGTVASLCEKVSIEEIGKMYYDEFGNDRCFEMIVLYMRQLQPKHDSYPQGRITVPSEIIFSDGFISKIENSPLKIGKCDWAEILDYPVYSTLSPNRALYIILVDLTFERPCDDFYHWVGVKGEITSENRYVCDEFIKAAYERYLKTGSIQLSSSN